MRAATTTIATLALAVTIGAQTRLTTVPVASGFSSSVAATTAPGDAGRLFVVEQSTGLIRIVRQGAILPTPFLNIRARLSVGGERGLLGMAFHPAYQQNGYFYVDYTRASDGATIVERFAVSSNPDVADPQSGSVMLGPIAQPYANHNGGCLQFGPDGYLYVSTGDGGSGGDPSCNAQNRASLLGKLLRIDVDSPTTRIPPSNPFVGNPSYRGEIWAYGLRNPWRFSFDRTTGDLWIGDVGQDAWEEVDFQPVASTGGENYGWKVMEGNACYSTSACAAGTPTCNAASLTRPVQVYGHTSGCAITGGYVYRGRAIPDLRGTYFYGDYCSARIWALRYDGQRVSGFREVTTELRPASGSISAIASFGEDADGELLIVSLSGTIWKVVAAGASPARDLGLGTPGTGGLTPRFDVDGRLNAGAIAELRLSDAAASAPTAILLSSQNNPTPFPPIGTLVPYPVAFSAAFVTDAQGVVTAPIAGGGRAAIAYAQWAVLDAAAAGGVALSNALEITIP